MAEQGGSVLPGIAKIGGVVLAIAAVIGVAGLTGYAVESFGGEKIYGQMGGGVGASLLGIPGEIASWFTSAFGEGAGTLDGTNGIEQVGEATKIDPEVIKALNEQADALGGADGALQASATELKEFVTELDKLKTSDPALYSKIVDSFSSHGFSITELQAKAASLADIENIDFKNMTGRELETHITDMNFMHDAKEAFASSDGFISQAIDDKTREIGDLIKALDPSDKDFATDKKDLLEELTKYKESFEPFQTASADAQKAIISAKDGLEGLRDAQHAVLNPSVNPYAVTAAVAAGGATAYGIAKMGSHAEREQARRDEMQDMQVQYS